MFPIDRKVRKGKELSSENLTLARRYIESVQGNNDMAAADALVAEDFKYYSALAPTGFIEGREAFKQAISGLHAGFPDIDLVIEDAFAGDAESNGRVVIRFRATGTHLAPFLGIAPTGKPIVMIETHTIRVRGGRIVEDYAADNNYDFPYLVAPLFNT